MTAKEALLIPLVVLTCLAAAEVGLHRVEKLRPLPRTYVGEHTSKPNEVMIADPVIGWR
jgi:hypothetical protein